MNCAQRTLMVFIIPFPLLSVLSCGSLEPPENPFTQQKNKNNPSHDDALLEDTHEAELNLNSQTTTSDAIEPFVEIDYKKSDFLNAIRCKSEFILRDPTGRPVRLSTGKIDAKSQLEQRAVWEFALAATESCQLVGEKVVRPSFNDSLAPAGSYFYLFSPCRESLSSASQPTRIRCSYNLVSTLNIELRNSLSEQAKTVAQKIAEKEAQLASIALRFREHMMNSLQAQKNCQNNEAVDAVKEARMKALSGLLMTGIAASVGGVIWGPQGAATAAQKTLQWIYENYPPGTTHNSSRCQLVADAEQKAKELAGVIDTVTKEISQLKAELASLYQPIKRQEP